MTPGQISHAQLIWFTTVKLKVKKNYEWLLCCSAFYKIVTLNIVGYFSTLCHHMSFHNPIALVSLPPHKHTHLPHHYYRLQEIKNNAVQLFSSRTMFMPHTVKISQLIQNLKGGHILRQHGQKPNSSL